MAQRAARLKREREAMNREEARAMKRMRLDWADLPSEILVLVMQEVARLPPDEQDDDSKPETHRRGAVPTVPRVASVCRGWRDAVLSDPRALWRHVDLSYGWARPSDAIVRRYCTNGDWSKLTHLSLADCGVLTDAALRALHQHCPELVSLDVSGTSKLTLGAMKPLGERLTELRLDRVSAKSMGGTNQLIVGMLTEPTRHSERRRRHGFGPRVHPKPAQTMRPGAAAAEPEPQRRAPPEPTVARATAIVPKRRGTRGAFILISFVPLTYGQLH